MDGLLFVHRCGHCHSILRRATARLVAVRELRDLRAHCADVHRRLFHPPPHPTPRAAVWHSRGPPAVSDRFGLGVILPSSTFTTVRVLPCGSVASRCHKSFASLAYASMAPA